MPLFFLKREKIKDDLYIYIYIVIMIYRKYNKMWTHLEEKLENQDCFLKKSLELIGCFF